MTTSLSGGRLELGLGAGGVPLDHSMTGTPPWSRTERAARFAEAVLLVDQLLRCRQVTFEYRVSAQYDDLVAVHIRTSRIGDRSLTLDAEMYRGDSDTLLTLGCLVHVAIDPATKQ